MRPSSVLAKAALFTSLACAACASKRVSETPPPEGIVESIADAPVTDVSPGIVPAATAERGLSEAGPVNLGAFRTSAAQEARIDSLLAIMTLAEKAGQMNQYTSFYDVTGPAPEEGSAAERYAQISAGLVGSMLNVTGAQATRKLQAEALKSRLGIPLLFAFDVIHGFETQFPVPLAGAATWDMALVEQAARWAAEEASAHGLHWTFAPMVDVSPDARWGRIVEGAGEDPYLGSRVAAARVRGFQGDDLAAANTIASCAKHLAGYGYARGGRDYNAADVSAYVLHNEILPPFRAAAEAGSATFMNGFNTVGGLPVTADPSLQREWLKGELRWPGFVVSDWNSIGELIPHGVAAGRAEAAELALEAGSDMDMETRAYVDEVVGLVDRGEVDEGLVDDAVRRILRVKMALGLFDDPFRYCDPAREASVTDDPALRAAAIATAAASAVLLKNEGGLLPLSAEDLARAVVIGDLAADTDSPLGTWSLAAERNSAVSLLAGIAEVSGRQPRYSPGPPTLVPGSAAEFLRELDVNVADRSGFDEAVAAARVADRVILVLGEPGFMSGEARSRASLDLPGLQRELFDAVYAANPNVVVVLYTGRPLAIESVAARAPALLCAWQPGSYGNVGIAEVLLGERDAAGRLPVSFPYAVGQEPLTYRQYSTGRPAPAERSAPGDVVFNSHYMDTPTGALFPFGHGLSYASWELDSLTVAPRGEDFLASVTLANVGERAGTQTVQLYLRDPVAQRARPTLELVGFRRVSLPAGGSATVEIPLSRNDLAYWTPEEGWHAEPGAYELRVGLSSGTLGEPVGVALDERP